MKKLIILFLALLTGAFAQTLYFEENFDYPLGDTLTAHGWTAHSGASNNPISTTGGLSFTGYVSSGIGNAALLDNTGEDDNKSLGDTINSGTIYYTFLVKVTNGPSDYFIHLKKSGTNYAARVFVQPSGTGFNFGLSNTSTGTFDSTTVYSLDTIYLCIVKYDVSSSDVSLWVKSEADGVPQSENEAGTPLISTSGTGQTGIIALALRQYSSSQNITVDGIRVADSWLQAPLPVELTSFTSNILTNGVELKWQTTTEVNNYGFEVEKKAPLNLPQGETYGDWETIGFVEGNGNSNSPKDYSFVDNDIQNQLNGKYYYRLKQIDTDGSYEYSETIEINWTNGVTDVNDNQGLPTEFALSQNYPNPFNPSTKIKYAIPSFGTQNPVSVKLKIYNVMGQEITTLVNEIKSPGEYEVEFNGKGLSSGMSAKGGYASGVYFYKIEAGNFVEVKKMILLK